MFDAIREGNNINKEVLKLHKEMLNVIIAKSKEEAENMLEDIANKAKKTNDYINASISLLKHGKSIIDFMVKTGVV